MVLAPGLLVWPEQLLSLLETFSGIAVLGPRSGSKTENFSIPDLLPPAIPNFDCKVSYVETFARSSDRKLALGGAIRTWLETVETTEVIVEQTDDGTAVLIGDKQLRYLTAWPNTEAMTRILGNLAAEAGLDIIKMQEGVRRRCTGSHEFVFNHNADPVKFRGQTIDPAGVVINHLC
jgi:beta-galactosidase